MSTITKLFDGAACFKNTSFIVTSGESNGRWMTLRNARRKLMNTKNIIPSSIDGMKRLAKQYKANGSTKSHSELLNEISMSSGYENFRHAQNVLTGKAVMVKKYDFHISAHWRDEHTKQRGLEKLTIQFSTPLLNMIKPNDLKIIRTTAKFILDGNDRLNQYLSSRSQESARDSVCEVARILHFLECTKLRPSTGYSRALPDHKRIPGQDHINAWFDEQKRYLITDEPYIDKFEHTNGILARSEWCEAHNYSQIKPNWLGMRNPDGGTHLYLFSSNKNGVPLEDLLEKLNKLPPSISPKNWLGESKIFN